MVDPALFAKLQKLCLRSFPDRLDQRLSQIQPQDRQRHPMVAFTLSWRQGQQPRVEQLIVRRYGDAWTWWSQDDRDKAQREWAVMRWLYGEGLPVPQAYGTSAEWDGYALLLGHVAGRSAARLWEEGASPGRGKFTSRQCVEGLADLLAAQHRLIPPGTVRERVPAVSTGEEIARLDGMARQCQDGGLQEAAAELRGYQVEELPPCVVHGDPAVASVLCDARGITALVDWENSAMGDPRWDVACVTNWLRAAGDQGLVDCFCATYQDRSQVSLSALPLWETLSATQRWATALWVRASAQGGPPQPPVETWSGHAWRALTRLRNADTPLPKQETVP